MKAQHTLGPWTADTGKQIEFRCVGIPIWRNDGTLLGCSFGAKEEAGLIAAAPVLLSALADARNRLADMLKGDDGQAWKEAERAVTKIDSVIAKIKEKRL